MKNRNPSFLAIAKNRASDIRYIAERMTDGSGIRIRRNNNGVSEIVATFIDCDEYVSTAVRVESHHVALMSRCPSSKFVSSLPEEYRDQYEDPDGEFVVSVDTNAGNTMRVHLAAPDEKEKLFRKVIITRDDGHNEKVVAHVFVENNNEVNVTAYGFPSGYEVE